MSTGPESEETPAAAAAPQAAPLSPVQYNVVDHQWSPSDPAAAQAMLTQQGQAGWQLSAVWPDPQRERTRWVFAAAGSPVQYNVVDQQWSPSDPAAAQAMLTQQGQAGWQLSAVWPDPQRERTRWIFSQGPAAASAGIPEAPADGQLYARQGSTASWQPVPQGRNRLINGHFVVDQRYSFGGVTPAINPAYVCDRWSATISQASKISFQAIPESSRPAATGAGGAMQMSTAAAVALVAGDVFALAQAIEFSSIADLGFGSATASPITLSFWAVATVAGAYSGSLQNYAGNRSYIFTFALAASVWTKVTISIPGDTAGTWNPGGSNAGGMRLSFDLGSGATYRTATTGSWIAGNLVGANGAASMVANAGAYLNIANVQLELGAVATPFDWCSVGDTLAACQRYYEPGGTIMWSGNISSGSPYYSNFRFRVVKRATPSMTYTDVGNTGFPAGLVTTSSVNPDGIIASKMANATGNGYYQFNFTASAEL